MVLKKMDKKGEKLFSIWWFIIIIIIGFDIFSECSLSQSVFDNGKFFIKISVSDFLTGESVNGHSFGNNAFEKNCDIKSKITAVKYPECSSKSVYVIYKDNKKYLVNVLAASNYKGGKN